MKICKRFFFDIRVRKTKPNSNAKIFFKNIYIYILKCGKAAIYHFSHIYKARKYF